MGNVHIKRGREKREKREREEAERLRQQNIEKVLKLFQYYFIYYGSIKSLDSNYDSSYKDIYENIKLVLNNSQFKIELFKKEFKVYKDDNREEEIKVFKREDEEEGKENIIKVIYELIELKDDINLNFEVLPDNNKKNNDEQKQEQKEEIEEKRANIVKFVIYIEKIQSIINYISYLENKGCPFLIDIVVNIKKGEIKYELVNNPLEYNELIFILREYCNTIVEYQIKFYKENEYFRFVYEKQLYRLYKRTKRKDKDISSYVRFFTNVESTKDDVPLFDSKFKDASSAYKYYRFAIKENFDLISKYIENIFEINGTSLDKLYGNINIEEKAQKILQGIFKCNIKKSNIYTFIIKMFLKFTNTFPIAQNILLTNNKTTTGEINSFMYRSIKCRFHTLFIILISEDFSIQNLNIITNLLNQIIN